MSLNLGGRPRQIATPEEMDQLVDAYVAKCRIDSEPLTLTGLILAIGLSSRQALDLYLTYDGFIDSVKRAKLLIEHEYEKGLRGSQATGPIFALKNFGWKDTQKFEHAGFDGGAVKTETLTFTVVKAKALEDDH